MNTRQIVAAAALCLPFATAAALADDTPPPGIKFGAQLDAGISGNLTNYPSSGLDYGQLYTDKANSPQVNQVLLSVGKAVDPKATDYDVGFKVQGMWGTDARYTHFSKLLDKTTRGPMQFDIVEASVDAFTPWLTEGGINWQAGLWPTLLGYETIDTSTNPFYTHSYIYNFGLPVKHSGVNAIVHATDALDVYVGITAGNQTVYGRDNNNSSSFLGGFKYTFSDSLNVLALTSYGPENAQRAISPLKADKYNRSYNDVVVSYKATDDLTLTTELNYINEDLGIETFHGIKNAEGGGIAQYASYTINDNLTANARAEVFSDTRGYFVAAYPGSLDPINAVTGNSYNSYGYFGSHSTYGACTVGVTYKPTMPDRLSSITALIRPELRVDSVLGGPARFNDGKDRTAVLGSIDIVLTY